MIGRDGLTAAKTPSDDQAFWHLISIHTTFEAREKPHIVNPAPTLLDLTAAEETKLDMQIKHGVLPCSMRGLSVLSASRSDSPSTEISALLSEYFFFSYAWSVQAKGAKRT